jgi:hypothetical protein
MHRDPETGQFLAHDESFKDIEVASFGITIGIPAQGLGGATAYTGGDTSSFEGVEMIDFDQIVDRNEELVLIEAQHALVAEINSTETADGSVRAAVEISADPSLSPATRAAGKQTNDAQPDSFSGTTGFDDSIDLVGRPLVAQGTGPFSDSSTGVGGGGSAGEDSVEIRSAPAEFGRFHPRDEVFVNGITETDNVDDAGIHLQISGQHVFGVVESC